MEPPGIPVLEKKVLAASFVFIAALLGLIAYSVYALGIAVPTCAALPPFTKAEIIAHGPGRFEVHLLARMWEFEPNRIRVPKGSVVDFYVISEDVTHGFYIDRTNVNLMVLPGVVNYARARFGEAGLYRFRCHEYCGINHGQMQAVVEVTDSTETAKTPR